MTFCFLGLLMTSVQSANSSWLGICKNQTERGGKRVLETITNKKVHRTVTVTLAHTVAPQA